MTDRAGALGGRMVRYERIHDVEEALPRTVCREMTAAANGRANSSQGRPHRLGPPGVL